MLQDPIIKQLLALVIDCSNLTNPASIQGQPAIWIQDKDITADTANLFQRFILALFYITTAASKLLRFCNPPVPKVETATCNYSEPIQASLSNLTYVDVPSGRWLLSAHECEWAGVLCDEFLQVWALQLYGQQIQGTLPSKIALFPYLQSISLQANKFNRSLPSQLGSMKHLLAISLHSNFFTGEVSFKWYNASRALQH